MARLQSEFCTKDFFRATTFITKNAPKFSPEFLSLRSVGQKKSRKIPSKFPTKFSKFPCEKSKKNHRRASAGAQGERFESLLFFLLRGGKGKSEVPGRGGIGFCIENPTREGGGFSHERGGVRGGGRMSAGNFQGGGS